MEIGPWKSLVLGFGGWEARRLQNLTVLKNGIARNIGTIAIFITLVPPPPPRALYMWKEGILDVCSAATQQWFLCQSMDN